MNGIDCDVGNELANGIDCEAGKPWKPVIWGNSPGWPHPIMPIPPICGWCAGVSLSSSLSGPGPLITFPSSTDALASPRLLSFLRASSPAGPSADPIRRPPASLPSRGVSGALPELLSPVELGGLTTNGRGPGRPLAPITEPGAIVIRPRSSTEREPRRLLLRVTPTPGTRRGGRGGGAALGLAPLGPDMLIKGF